MKLSHIVSILAVLALSGSGVLAQAPIGSILRVEIENQTVYVFDCPNSELATNPNKLTRSNPIPKTFESTMNFGDIVSVNGTPVKGSVFESISYFTASPTGALGQAISDTTHGGMYLWNLEFLNLDGTPIGAVQISGLSGGARPPGYPREIPRNGAYIVTGGTGVFFGVRGYWQADPDAAVPVRTTSACEDPAFRRTHGGGKIHAILYLVPLSQPQIVMTATGPAVVHSNDNSPVTTAKPAKSSEILTLYATGLGPTRPGVEPGQPFTADPRQVVNSPVQVFVNGRTSEVLYAGGYPGTADGYQVNFRVPDGITPGQASIQVTSAWNAGPEAKVPVSQ